VWGGDEGGLGGTSVTKVIILVTQVFLDRGTLDFNHEVIRDGDNGNKGWNMGE
jgi:hypothetical protein